MTDHPRSISVTVEEPVPGAFYWPPLETKDDATAWTEVSFSDKAFKPIARQWLLACSSLQD